MSKKRNHSNNENMNPNINAGLNDIEGINQSEIQALQDALKKDQPAVMNAMINHILKTFNSQGYNFKSIDEIIEYMQQSYNQ